MNDKYRELVSRVEEAARQSAVSRSEERRRSPAHPRRTLLLALTAVLVAIAGYQMRAHSLAGRVTPAMAEASLRTSIYVAALALDAEWEETGQLPASLEELGVDDEGLSYVRAESGYTLIAEGDGLRFEYQSGEDLGPYRAAFEASLPPFGAER